MKGRVRPFEYMQWAMEVPSTAAINLAASGIADRVDGSDHDPPWALDLPVNELSSRVHRRRIIEDFIQAIAERYGVEPECVTPTLGASQAILHALIGLVRAGDHVIVERPTYEALHRVPNMLGADVSRLERRFDESWDVMPDRLAKLLTPKTRVVMLTSLHNPSGVGIRTEVMEAVGEMADRVGAMVLVDEVYLDFCFDAEHAPCRPAALVLDNGVSWSSTTKTFGFSALRAGWIVTRNPDAARAMRQAAHYLHVDVPVSSALLGARVLKNAPGLTRRAADAADAGRAVVERWLLRESRVSWVPPTAGITGLIRLPHLLSEVQFSEHLRDRYDTQVVPGSMFEAPGTVRLSFGIDPDQLEEGLSRFSQALDDLTR